MDRYLPIDGVQRKCAPRNYITCKMESVILMGQPDVDSFWLARCWGSGMVRNHIRKSEWEINDVTIGDNVPHNELIQRPLVLEFRSILRSTIELSITV